MTVLICPVRPGDHNPELLYALRSWEANLDLPGGLELWTVGHKPEWLVPDRHLQGNNFRSMPLAVFDNISIAAKAATEDSVEEAVFMNDDFFCLDPVGKVLPVRRKASLRQQRAHYPPGSGLWWPRSLALTVDWLEGEGFPDPDSYEVHRPLVADPGAMLWALREWSVPNWETLTDTVPQWRTLYGVLNKVDAHPVSDVKLGGRATGYGSPWISTSDESWRRYARDISQRFQKPSRWEK